MTLLSSLDGKKVLIENAKLKVASMMDTAKVVLGFVSTDWKGKASLDILPARALAKGVDGTYNFNISFEGNNQYAAVEDNLKVKDIFLELGFDEKDTGKMVNVFAYELNDKLEKVQVPGLDVDFCVSRIFCNFPFGAAKTDAEGKCGMAFPKRMPGDSAGQVTLVARIVDNETYANAETRKTVKWGVPVFPEENAHRGLGDTDAPLWMVYTLIVLLSAVWLHFSYIIFLVLRINYLGRKMLRDTAGGTVQS